MKSAAALLAVLLCACASIGGESAGCVRTATRDIIWSNASAPDVMTARVSGADCLTADVNLTITSAAGDVLATGGVNYAGMNFGDRTHDLPPVSHAEMDAFLNSWLAGVWTLRSSELPDWALGATHLPRAELGASYETYLDRATYLELRARDLPVLCFDVATETAECYAFDPITRRALPIAVYGI